MNNMVSSEVSETLHHPGFPCHSAHRSTRRPPWCQEDSDQIAGGTRGAQLMARLTTSLLSNGDGRFLMKSGALGAPPYCPLPCPASSTTPDVTLPPTPPPPSPPPPSPASPVFPKQPAAPPSKCLLRPKSSRAGVDTQQGRGRQEGSRDH